MKCFNCGADLVGCICEKCDVDNVDQRHMFLYQIEDADFEEYSKAGQKAKEEQKRFEYYKRRAMERCAGEFWTKEVGDCYYYGRGVEEDEEDAGGKKMNCINCGATLAGCMCGKCGIDNINGKHSFIFQIGEADIEEYSRLGQLAQAKKERWGIKADNVYTAEKSKNHGEVDLFTGPEEQYEIGDSYYYRGEFGRAVEWYAKAAERGYAKAQYKLACCYYSGEGVPWDVKKAVEWWGRAAEQGDAGAQFKMGCCVDRAIEWYRSLAEQGNAEGQYELGCCYLEGNGVKQNLEKAIEWFRKSAEQGNVESQNRLGCCYLEGTGVEQNLKKAVEWFRKSAKQGNDEGRYLLEYCYQKGLG